jgi:hypothetical protein
MILFIPAARQPRPHIALFPTEPAEIVKEEGRLKHERESKTQPYPITSPIVQGSLSMDLDRSRDNAPCAHCRLAIAEDGAFHAESKVEDVPLACPPASKPPRMAYIVELIRPQSTLYTISQARDHQGGHQPSA